MPKTYAKIRFVRKAVALAICARLPFGAVNRKAQTPLAGVTDQKVEAAAISRHAGLQGFNLLWIKRHLASVWSKIGKLATTKPSVTALVFQRLVRGWPDLIDCHHG